MPKFRVNSITGKDFRRNGITFTGAPQVVDTDKLGWTEEQLKNLRSAGEGGANAGAALHVEPLDVPPGTPAEAVAAAHAAGVSLPGHPTQEEADKTPPTRGRGR